MKFETKHHKKVLNSINITSGSYATSNELLYHISGSTLYYKL